MPKVFKVLSSKEVIESFGFVRKSQRGSHIKMAFNGEFMSGHVVVPERKEIPQGTMRSIIRQAGQFVDSVTLEEFFKN